MPDLFFQSGVGPTNTASNVLQNVGITATVGANALTITLTDSLGATPTASSAPSVSLGFRNATGTSGLPSVVNVTAATSIVIPASTTIGTANGVPAYVYVYALNNLGTVELAVSLAGYIDEAALLTTTAISGGSSATTVYSTAARTTLPVRFIGRIAILEATAGTWATAPTEVATVPFRQTKQLVVGSSTSAASVTATSYTVFTNPQVTIVPVRTGLYKIWGSLTFSSTANNDVFFKIAATVGSPTVSFQSETRLTVTASSIAFPFFPYLLATLTAGTTYTFALFGLQQTSGTITLTSNANTNGQALVAEEQ